VLKLRKINRFLVEDTIEGADHKRFIMYGPQEDYDSMWRTTAHHTPQSMMSVYREVYFCGFPRLGGGADNTVVFPEPLARDLFTPYGAITDFCYDPRRGCGAVVFADGSAAYESRWHVYTCTRVYSVYTRIHCVVTRIHAYT